MKNIIIFIIFLTMNFAFGKAESFLDTSGGYPHLKIGDERMIILGGELGNSSVTSFDDIETNLTKVKSMGLNTVLVPAYWDLTEPEEGVFDFSLTDKIIDTAKEKDLKIVFLWFGVWKNSMSCYVPGWVKRDTDRFPRAKTQNGKPLEILSAFSSEVLKTDKAAFKTWLDHIMKYDKANNVVMVQIENEIGMLEDARDYSPEANAEYEKGVPPELMEYLNLHVENLDPQLSERWKANGRKMTGSWKEVFGDYIFSDEYFMAWSYGKYVEQLAREGRKITKMPFYLNAAMNSRGRMPGEYPSAGPLAHLKDIWHAAAPTIDFLSPDIYDSGFEGWVEKYALKDNILFIPEMKRDLNNPAQVYYVTGHHNALGCSPFSIENGDDDYSAYISGAYAIINELTPVLLSGKNNSFMDGVLLDAEKPETILTDGSTKITLSHYFTLPWDSRAADKNNWRQSGALLIKLAEDEYILAGNGVVAKFEDVGEESNMANLGEDGFLNAGEDRLEKKSGNDVNPGWNSPRKGLETVEEVKITPEGKLKRVRTHNGDETHQGRHARISVDDNKILHIKTYTY